MAELAAAPPCVIVFQHFDRISLMRIIEQLQSLLAVTIGTPAPPPPPTPNPNPTPSPSQTSCVNESLQHLVDSLPKSPFSGLPLITPKSLPTLINSPISRSRSPSPSPSQSSPLSSPSLPLSPPSACPLNTLGSELSESKEESKEKPEIITPIFPIPVPGTVPDPVPLMSPTPVSPSVSDSVVEVHPSKLSPSVCPLNTFGSDIVEQQKDQLPTPPLSKPKSKAQRKRENRKVKKREIQSDQSTKEWIENDLPNMLSNAHPTIIIQELEFVCENIDQCNEMLNQLCITRLQKEKYKAKLQDLNQAKDLMERELIKKGCKKIE